MPKYRSNPADCCSCIFHYNIDLIDAANLIIYEKHEHSKTRVKRAKQLPAKLEDNSTFINIFTASSTFISYIMDGLIISIHKTVILEFKNQIINKMLYSTLYKRMEKHIYSKSYFEILV